VPISSSRNSRRAGRRGIGARCTIPAHPSGRSCPFASARPAKERQAGAGEQGRQGGVRLAAKIFGWAIYAVGFAIWLFGYLSAGHAPLFNWNAATPWWIKEWGVACAQIAKKP